MLQIVGKYRWRQSCRYKKLTEQHEKSTTPPPPTTTARSTKRQNLGKKNEIRAKGFRLNRSRKLVLKALALPRRIFNIYVRITNQMKREEAYMVELYSICGEWKFNEKLQWEFLVELHKGASVFEVDEIVTYKDLIEMVSEDFGIDYSVKAKTVTLSYGLPMVEDFPPVYLQNDRQLRSFVNKIKEHPKLIRLCVPVSDICSIVPLDDVGSNINSKTMWSSYSYFSFTFFTIGL